ncbi:hypothetical protein PRIC1_011127 [Phytophthora ramorum]
MKTVSELFGDRNDLAVTAAAAVAVSLGLSLLVHKSKKNKSTEARKLPPMPKTTLPIFKSLFDIGNNLDRFHDWLLERSAEFDNKPWMYSIPGRPVTIVLTAPEYLKDVMVTQEDVFLRGPLTQYMSEDIFGNGMIVTDGDPWFFHRKTSSHLFSMQMMKDVMETTVRDKLDVFLDVLDIYHKRGKPFSIKKDISHFTTDAICRIGFGIELDTLRNGPDSDEDHTLLKAFDLASIAFVVRVQTPWWIWEPKRFFNVGWEKVFKDNVKIVHDFIDEVILQSMNRKAELAAKGEKMEARDLITMFMESNLKETEHMNFQDNQATIMRDMVTTFMFAGKDTVGHSLSWFIVHINRYPDTLKKIREEMKEKLPGLLTGEIRVPTHEQLRELIYLEAAVRENVRLFPSTGFIAREAMRDTTLVDGTFVGKGQTIMVSSYCNTRNKKLWGEDALEFNPDRMIDPETGKLRVFSPYQYSGFGSGQHVCIGQKFAMMQMKLAMATLLSKFDIKTVEDPWKLTYDFSLTIPVHGPLDVVVTPLTPLSSA